MSGHQEINVSRLHVGQKFDSFSGLCVYLGVEKPKDQHKVNKLKKAFSPYFSFEDSDHARYGIVITEIYAEKRPIPKCTRMRASKYEDLILPIVLSMIEENVRRGEAPVLCDGILMLFEKWGLVNSSFVDQRYKTYQLTKEEFRNYPDITYEFLDTVYDKIKTEVFDRTLNKLERRGFKICRNKWWIKKSNEEASRISTDQEDTIIEEFSNEIMDELKIQKRNLRFAGKTRAKYDKKIKEVLEERMLITSHAHRISIEIDSNSFESLLFNIFGQISFQERRKYAAQCKQKLNELIVELILNHNNTLKGNYLSGKLSNTEFQKKRRSFILAKARAKELETLEYNEKRFNGFLTDESRYAETYKKERDRLVKEYIELKKSK